MCRRLVVGAGAAACCAAGAWGQGEATAIDIREGVHVVPVAVAPAVLTAEGVRRTGDWAAYAPPSSRAGEMIFDCIEPTGDCGSYSYFQSVVGPATDDFTVAADTDVGAGISRADFAWKWHCGGNFGSEACIVGLFTQESSPTECEPDSQDYSGWLLDFGTLTCNLGGYFASNVDLGGGTWPLPSDGSGSYVFGFVDDESNWVTHGSQMFWGTGDARGDPAAPGAQETERLEDNNPQDGVHEVPTECYTYSLGRCPDPLGGAMGFWGSRGDPCARYDCNNDGTVNTRDFMCFLNMWNSQDGYADCDGNSIFDTRDITCFLSGWASCR